MAKTSIDVPFTGQEVEASGDGVFSAGKIVAGFALLSVLAPLGLRVGAKVAGTAGVDEGAKSPVKF